MRRMFAAVVVTLLCVGVVWAEDAAVVAEEKYHPGFIVNGVSFVDARQVAAIDGGRFDAVENYYVKFIKPTAEEVKCQIDGKIIGPAAASITETRPPQIYSDSCAFVPAKVFSHLGHKITWDGKLSVLTVDDTHRIPILEKAKWYAIVQPPTKAKAQAPAVNYVYEQEPTTGAFPTGGIMYSGSWQPPSSYTGGGSSRKSYSSGGGPVHVRSYTRKDGTRVRAHTRSRPRR